MFVMTSEGEKWFQESVGHSRVWFAHVTFNSHRLLYVRIPWEPLVCVRCEASTEQNKSVVAYFRERRSIGAALFTSPFFQRVLD